MSQELERSIPKSQRDIDENIDSGQLTPYEEAQDLSKEFAHIDNRTISEDTILADVKGIYKASTGGSIAVEVDLPGPEESSETFNFTSPKVWSGQYEFVRWVEHYGYGSSNFEAMIRDDVEVEVLEGSGRKDYELYVPQKTGDRLRSVMGSIKEKTVPSSDQELGIKFILTTLVFSVLFTAVFLNGFLSWQEVQYSAEFYTGPNSAMTKSEAISVLSVSYGALLTFLVMSNALLHEIID